MLRSIKTAEEISKSRSATVFVVDDDDAMLESIRFLIESVELQVKTFPSAKDFLDNYKSEEAGCLILDVRMAGMSGLELQQQLNENKVKIPIIFITGHGDVQMAVKAMQAKAFEFLTKPFNDQTLLDSINKAIAFDAEKRKDHDEIKTINECMNRLTPREKEIMHLVVMGKLNKVIAAELDISPKTVELHRSKIMEKMQVNSLANLVRVVLTHQHVMDGM